MLQILSNPKSLLDLRNLLRVSPECHRIYMANGRYVLRHIVIRCASEATNLPYSYSYSDYFKKKR